MSISTTNTRSDGKSTALKLVSTMAVVGVVSFGAVALTACGSEVTKAAESASSAGIASIDGRGVSATDTQLVLRTPDGERTFVIRPEDENAVGPEHVESHLGIESIGFKVYYVNEGGVDYAVSVEEIDGSNLGFS